MGHKLIATQPMEVVSIDYLAMPRDRHGKYKAVLVIVDQLTRLCIIVPTTDETAETAARIFHDRWLSLFPDPTFLITDGGTHFRCALFRKLTEIRGFEHHIVAPHSQWGNGGVERLNRVFLDKMKALLNSQGEDLCDWNKWVPVAQEAINKVLKVASRGGRTPCELLTGMLPQTAARRLSVLGVEAEQVKFDSVPADTLLEHLDGIHEALALLWEKASDAQLARQQENSRARAKKRVRKENIPHIQLGDTVLVAEAVPSNKLQMTWTGPHQVVNAVSPYVYEVEPMLPVRGRRRRKLVHIVRLRRFANGELGSRIDAKRIEREALKDYPDNVVKRFVSHHKDKKGTFMIRVRWLGYDQAHDTDEPIHNLAKDVPNLVEEYLTLHKGEKACDRMLKRYFS